MIDKDKPESFLIDPRIKKFSWEEDPKIYKFTSTDAKGRNLFDYTRKPLAFKADDGTYHKTIEGVEAANRDYRARMSLKIERPEYIITKIKNL